MDPWVRKISQRKTWQSIQVCFPGESRRQRSLVGYSPQGNKELDTTEATEHAHTHRDGNPNQVEVDHMMMR